MKRGALREKAIRLLADLLGGSVLAEDLHRQWGEMMVTFYENAGMTPLERWMAGMQLTLHEWEDGFAELQDVYIEAQRSLDTVGIVTR